MTRLRPTSYIALVLVCACNATNTGNPATPGGAPEGVELLRSNLARDKTPSVTPDERVQFGRDERDLAFALYDQINAGEDNVFFSPYSIAVALGMTYAGAKGETKTEMSNALHFELAEPTLHAAFNATDLALQGRQRELAGGSNTSDLPRSTGDGFSLQVTNAAFTRKGLAIVPAYLDVLATNYGAGMFEVDIAAQPDRERMAINRWVEMQTQERIRELLPDGSIAADVALVLVNAIYFKASWMTPFDEARTQSAPFHAPGSDVSVQMMHGSAEQYVQGDGYQAVELPYISPSVRMLFIVPAQDRFAEIESRLDTAFFDQVRTALGRYSVDLKLPRFSFDASFALKPALQALGMKRAFEGSADLSGIAGKPGDLYIDEVYHKAFVALDEQGTEAAAATAVVARETSLPPPAQLALDRPFMFAIYDEPTGQVLFVGRLMHPQ